MRAAIILSCAIFLVLTPLIPAHAGPGKPAKLDVGADAPRVSCKLIDGTEVGMDRLIRENKAVVIAFWGIRCAACIEEIPALEKIRKEYADRSVQVLGINVDGLQPVELREMMKEAKIEINYKIVVDPDFKIADSYGLVAAPLSIVIGNDGKIGYIHRDYKPGDESEIHKILESLVGK